MSKPVDIKGFAAVFALLAGLIGAALLFSGCSDQRAVSQLPSTHPDTWMVSSSPDFHGQVALISGTASCAKCHGNDFGGGRVGVSCVACHLSSSACIACHGGLDNKTGAPPYGLRHEVSDSTLAVGAHTLHLTGTARSAVVTCQSCHLVPVTLLEPYHLEVHNGKVDSVAEITWQGFANGGNAVWNRTARTCTGTYCHGSFAGGYTSNAPVWTSPRANDCGTCHDAGVNPADLGVIHQIHILPSGLVCADCHSEVIDSSNTIKAPNLHVNGTVDILPLAQTRCDQCHSADPSACIHCHGGVDNATGAPPYGLRKEVDDTTLAVGAHTEHLAGTARSAAVACDACHLVPDSLNTPGHWDVDSTAEVIWHGYADGGGALWNRVARTCAGTYCHGNFTGGKPANAPIWTAPGQADCGSCHDVGANPASLDLVHEIHMSVDSLVCADCHSQVVDSTKTIIAPTLHVNGTVNVMPLSQALCDVCHGPAHATCTHCHGGVDNQTGAPPRGLRGEISASTVAVGAHTTHMEGGYVSNPFSCNECHLVPDSLNTPGHWDVDSTAEITWGALAGSASQWNRSTRQCGSTYCHGNFSGGYPNNAPIWNAPGQAACGSCHDNGVNPEALSGRHFKHVSEESIECYQCHAATVDATRTVIGKQYHVDGFKTVVFSSGQGTFQSGRCTNIGCHDPESW